MLQRFTAFAITAVLVLASFAGCVGMDPLGGNESNESSENLSTQNTSFSNQTGTNEDGTTTNTSDQNQASDQNQTDPFMPENATLAPNVTKGQAPLPVNFTLNATTHENGTWTLIFGDGNQTQGNATTFPATVPYTYQAAGNYTANFTVSYPENVTRSAATNLSVSAPEDQDGNQTDEGSEEGPIAEGTILVGHPVTGALGGASELGLAPEGVDGIRADLGQQYWGSTILAAGDSPAPYDLDIWYYDSGDSLMLDSSCGTESADETCEVPSGAAYAWIDAALGANIEVTVTEV